MPGQKSAHFYASNDGRRFIESDCLRCGKKKKKEKGNDKFFFFYTMLKDNTLTLMRDN